MLKEFIIANVWIDILIAVIVVCSLIGGIINYIKVKHFIRLSKINSLKDISDNTDACVVAVFDDTACILCLNVFRKLKRKLKYPLFYLDISNANQYIELEHFTPAIFIVDKGNIVSSIYANTQDKTSNVKSYLRYITKEIKVMENDRA